MSTGKVWTQDDTLTFLDQIWYVMPYIGTRLPHVLLINAITTSNHNFGLISRLKTWLRQDAPFVIITMTKSAHFASPRPTAPRHVNRLV
jgi:hypothetical protein